MTDQALHFKTISELAHLLRAGEVTSVALTQHYLDRVAALNPPLNAYRLVSGERALEEARLLDEELHSGQDRGILHGIPFAVKDIIDVADQPTTAGASLLADNVATEDANVVRRLRDAGMVLLGKTNTVQLAYGGAGINHDHGTPHNPWHEQPHVPGGSSSGSGVAVAAGMAPMALGSDTGGSVRLPAAMCGVTGLKTTVGQVSRHGVFPLSWTLDSVGPLARSAEDAAHLFGAMQGADPDDATTAGRAPHDVLSTLEDGVGGLRLAFAGGAFRERVDDEVSVAMSHSGEVLKDLGAEIVHLEFSEAEQAHQLRPAHVIIAAEAWKNNRNYYEKHFDGLDPIISQRLVLGRDISADQYMSFFQKMMELRNRMGRTLEDVDAVLVPTTLAAAAPVAEVDASLDSYNQYNFGLVQLTLIGNVLNLCGLTVPCGFTRKGLPIGLLIYGKPFCEETVLRVGRAFQQETDWHLTTPDLSWADGSIG